MRRPVGVRSKKNDGETLHPREHLPAQGEIHPLAEIDTAYICR